MVERSPDDREEANESKQPDEMLLVGPARTFSCCLRTALENEFPEIKVILLVSIKHLIDRKPASTRNVALILLDQSQCGQLLGLKDAIRQQYPNQPIALSFENNNARRTCWAVCGTFFEGFVPVDVRLDVWLSTIRVLLTGGHYVSPTLFETKDEMNGLPCGHRAMVESALPEATTPASDSIPGDARLKALTARELDVLKLVALGHQNKIIAAELSLSENTIKLHMHHIISKMGVTNRTEAAATYLNGTSVDIAV